MAESLIALGANLGDARERLYRAVAALCDGHLVRLLARSSALLSRAQEVERALGRVREQERRWGPRPVDIDLLTYDDVALTTPDLILPHPRLFERAFVLVPLAEIAPERVIAGRRVCDALAQVDTTGIEKLPPL